MKKLEIQKPVSELIIADNQEKIVDYINNNLSSEDGASSEQLEELANKVQEIDAKT